MILLPLLLTAAQRSAPAGPSSPSTETRYEACLDLAQSNPKAAEAEAGNWLLAAGGSLARQCLGMAYANDGRWASAAAEFEAAARAAEAANNIRAARYWTQAGNAWLAAGEMTKAQSALNAALAMGTLTGLNLGEAHLDRARALVAAQDLDGARDDIDAALADAPADPLAWLLSATLARRMDDLPRAKKDIAQALTLAGDDAAVQLEAGNIAALAGDADGAKAAWQQAANIASTSDAGKRAQAALGQFDPPITP